MVRLSFITWFAIKGALIKTNPDIVTLAAILIMKKTFMILLTPLRFPFPSSSATNLDTEVLIPADAMV